MSFKVAASSNGASRKVEKSNERVVEENAVVSFKSKS